jgi:hypothetical protein
VLNKLIYFERIDAFSLTKIKFYSYKFALHKKANTVLFCTAISTISSIKNLCSALFKNTIVKIINYLQAFAKASSKDFFTAAE